MEKREDVLEEPGKLRQYLAAVIGELQKKKTSLFIF